MIRPLLVRYAHGVGRCRPPGYPLLPRSAPVGRTRLPLWSVVVVKPWNAPSGWPGAYKTRQDSPSLSLTWADGKTRSAEEWPDPLSLVSVAGVSPAQKTDNSTVRKRRRDVVGPAMSRSPRAFSQLNLQRGQRGHFERPAGQGGREVGATRRCAPRPLVSCAVAGYLAYVADSLRQRINRTHAW